MTGGLGLPTVTSHGASTPTAGVSNMIRSVIGLRRALCVVVALVVAGCSTQTAGGDGRSAASDGSTVVLKDAWMYYQDPYAGIHLEGQFTPDRDGTTTGA